MNVRNTTKGFSLIEVLVYIAVLVLISVVVVSTYLSLSSVLSRNKTERELTQSASTAMEDMLRSIRGAATVNTLERTLPNEIAVDTADGTTTEFYLSGGRIYMDVNNQTIGPLTASDVTVSDLTFDDYKLTGTELVSEAVRISFTINAESKDASTTKTFYSTAVLRGSYE